MTFTDMAAVKERNRRTGHSFFEADTLRFFDGTVGRTLYGGRFFVTSEKGPHGPRRWTVRRANQDGTITTCGVFQQYASGESARTEAKRLAKEAP
jgi:hypothetical protein